LQLTHSLKAPGFNPRTYKVKKMVSSLCFQMGQIVPLHPGTDFETDLSWLQFVDERGRFLVLVGTPYKLPESS
jgi:hypothetical protein